jgi:hypothetical protein
VWLAVVLPVAQKQARQLGHPKNAKAYLAHVVSANQAYDAVRQALINRLGRAMTSCRI